MKLASLPEGRDGSLIVVSRDLRRATKAGAVAPTLSAALENWSRVEEGLRNLAEKLDAGDAPETFDLQGCRLAAPLPRAAQWCDGSAYLRHAELVRQARNAAMPEVLYSEPLMYQGASDTFLGPEDDIRIQNEEWGIDLEAEVAVVTDDVAMGTSATKARQHIRLIMLVNDVSLRNLIPAELEKGFGFLISKPATAFSPVAVTPDELGSAWDGAKVSLPLESSINGKKLGNPDAGQDLYFDFPRLISHAASTRELKAGTIVGSGTVSNRDISRGTSCLQETRMLEKLATGQMLTPFLRYGDRVRIEMRDSSGASIFGAIDQRVAPYAHGRPATAGD